MRVLLPWNGHCSKSSDSDTSDTDSGVSSACSTSGTTSDDEDEEDFLVEETSPRRANNQETNPTLSSIYPGTNVEGKFPNGRVERVEENSREPTLSSTTGDDHPAEVKQEDFASPSCLGNNCSNDKPISPRTYVDPTLDSSNIGKGGSGKKSVKRSSELRTPTTTSHPHDTTTTTTPSTPEAYISLKKRLRSSDLKPPAAERNNNKMAIAGRFKSDSDEEPDNALVLQNGRARIWIQPVENDPPPWDDPANGVAALNPAVAYNQFPLERKQPASMEAFQTMLKHQGLEMVEQEGDGNCLFRAVSLQVYGTADSHAEVRERCMDFMARNEEHYSSFVQGNFKEYVERKRVNGVHGNHAEIQALSELYNRPVEVYQDDGTPVNIFHQEYKTSDPPIRLSYHDGNHYNAVIDPLVPTAGLGLGLPGLKPGLADQLQITKAKTESDQLADQMELDRIIQESKADFKDSQDDELQRVLKESSMDYLYKQKSMAFSDLDATNYELEQKALSASLESLKRPGRKHPRARRRPSPVVAPAVASIPAAASMPSRDETASPSSLARPDEYPQVVQELTMNGFELSKVIHAYDLLGDNFDDLLTFLLSNSGAS